MDTEIIIFYCLADELLTAVKHHDDRQATMSSAEVMTTMLVAARYFGGNIDDARRMLLEQGYIPSMLSRSRLNRRLHALGHSLWQTSLAILGLLAQQNNPRQEYIIDSFPVAVCDNIRIRRCRIYCSEAYRGKIASKRRYFYGLRVHMLTTASGRPVEVVLTPGSVHDGTAFKQFDCDLPQDATIYGDKSYNDAMYEEHLFEHAGIRFLPLRKKNMLQQFPHALRYIQHKVRKRIETSFSQVTAMFPKSIHAVTPAGFELKVLAFCLAFSILSL